MHLIVQHSDSTPSKTRTPHVSQTAHLICVQCLSSYIANINVPSNPATVTSVLTSHSSKMTYFQRVKNTLAFLFLGFTRRLHFIHTTWTFWWNNRPLRKSVVDIESKILYFGTPFEFMLESPRPISNQIKYMGCPYAAEITREVHIKKELNISKISPDGIILVSFGSVTSGEHIPKNIIRTFLDVFGELNHTVVWQFGSHPSLIGMETPKNVHLYSWLPLQKLMASKEIKLMVGHGGIRSLLEAIHHHIPAVGIPIQGCQPHDLKRVVDKGAAEIIEIPYLTKSALSSKINNILGNLPRFQENTKQLSELILSYNSELNNERKDSDFWLTWAVRHGRKVKENGRFAQNSYVPMVQYYYLDLLAAISGLILVCWWLAQFLADFTQELRRNCCEKLLSINNNNNDAKASAERTVFGCWMTNIYRFCFLKIYCSLRVMYKDDN